MKIKCLKEKKCILQILQLCKSKIKVLCLIGIFKIGKTTIVKATLNNVNHIYNVFTFLSALKVVLIVIKSLLVF